MNPKNLFPMIFDLQLFAEGAGGGDGGTGSEGSPGASATVAASQTKAAKNNPLANVVYGIQPTAKAEEVAPIAEVQEPTTEPEDRNAKYEAFIKENKDLDDARIQSIVQRRLKSTKETVDKYNALTPTLELLAKKYGVDPTDTAALTRAIEEDDSYFEEEALKMGVPVEHLRELRRVKRENSELSQKLEAHDRKESAEKTYAGWMEQAEAARTVYPSLDLRAEMQNPQFVALLRSNIDVRTAYEVIHKDEIISGAMQFATKAAEQKLTNKIIANGARPTENGNASQSATVVKSDVSQLTRADRAEINRRVMRGDKISFG